MNVLTEMIDDDCISRRDAIDAVEREKIAHGRYTTSSYVGYEIAEKVIGQLPSVQPEIIRCKDCKYWNNNWNNKYWINGSCEYPEHAVNTQGYMTGDIETEAEHFCGYAEKREVNGNDQR